mmetsp:Transcript_1487/g.2452  ORF Transcript_1487/g.2452 Transcript_1487/m.2452 type:complete len:876 (-) Transcript_1487:278-2905(-)
MRTSVVCTSDGRLNTKLHRQKELKFKMFDSCPESYKSNTTKEELCIEYVNSFIDQFVDIYKNRRLPYMFAENEMGIKKFVCSTLRPTLIPIPELYDMYECASFIAGYVVYEPLDPPYEPPRYLFSPSLVIDSYKGDCFDMSNLLTSFLLGSGYDAYVVFGYAPKYITLKDQSMTQCTMLKNADESKVTVKTSDGGAEGEESETAMGSNTYVPPDNSVKNSKFLAEQQEKARLAALDTFQLWVADADLDEKQMMEDMKAMELKENDGKRRCHAWVLVCAGKRDVKEHMFIEPTTGRVYSINSSPYIGIESVWNHSNYWMNLQNEAKVSEMNYDLKSEENWDVLFLSGPSTASEEKQQNEDQAEEGFMEDAHEEKNETQATAVDPGARYFDAPPTWANPLNIARRQYLLKYPPHGKRAVQYYCAKADLFAKRSHPQSMVMRITTYLDQECTIVREIHEWFEGRTDCMYKRVRQFLGDRRFVEYYHPGSFGDVKKWTEYPGKRIECDYYVDGRLDRLLRSEETIGQSVVEHFSGRTDLLKYRSVLLTADRHLVGTRQFPLPGSSYGSELFAVRMAQEFDDDDQKQEVSAPGDQGEGGGGGGGENSVAKRIFNIIEGKAVIYSHFGKGKITGDVRTFLHAKGPTIPVMSDQALAQEQGLDDSPESLAMAGALERDCFNTMKASFLAMQKLREVRRDVESKIENERTVFERALDSADVAQSSSVSRDVDTTAESEATGTDYLTPFLRNVSGPGDGGGAGAGGAGGAGANAMGMLTKEDALEIRQACLDALKSRLVERANIIQTKLHEENAALGKTQEHFQRAQREGDFDTEKYEATCTAAMFRIQILEQRLASHEEAALRKFQELDAKLSNDPRLKVLRG